MSILIKMVQAVQLRQDRKWIPEELRDNTYFSVHDMWHYIGVSDERLCEYCAVNDGEDMTGDILRGKFPDLEIIDQNVIYPHVHKELVRQGIFGEWSEDSCRCVLIRMAAPLEILIELGYGKGVY